jgi:hypothetical protein
MNDENSSVSGIVGSKPAKLILLRRLIEEKEGAFRKGDPKTPRFSDRVFFVHPVDGETNRAIANFLNGECEGRTRSFRIPGRDDLLLTWELHKGELKALYNSREQGFVFDVYRIQGDDTIVKVDDIGAIFN